MWHSPKNKIECVQSPTINPSFTLELVDLTLCMLGNFICVLSSANFFQNHLFRKKSFKNTIIVSNSLDPDQARHLNQRKEDNDLRIYFLKYGTRPGFNSYNHWICSQTCYLLHFRQGCGYRKIFYLSRDK